MGDDAVAAHSADPGALVEGYEAMRDAVLGGRPEGWRHAYGVLAGRGMAAWMATWASLASAPAAGTPASTSPVPSTPSSSLTTDPSTNPTLSSLRNAGEIVAVVAQMALAHL